MSNLNSSSLAAPKLPSEGGQPFPGAIPPADSQNHEAALVKLYSDITGETESQARNAVIFVVRDKEDSSTTPPN